MSLATSAPPSTAPTATSPYDFLARFGHLELESQESDPILLDCDTHATDDAQFEPVQAAPAVTMSGVTRYSMQRTNSVLSGRQLRASYAVTGRTDLTESDRLYSVVYSESASQSWKRTVVDEVAGGVPLFNVKRTMPVGHSVAYRGAHSSEPPGRPRLMDFTCSNSSMMATSFKIAGTVATKVVGTGQAAKRHFLCVTDLGLRNMYVFYVVDGKPTAWGATKNELAPGILVATITAANKYSSGKERASGPAHMYLDVAAGMDLRIVIAFALYACTHTQVIMSTVDESLAFVPDNV
ncbi:hypothetical protein BC828DRAFT_407916 [Blastocladiella britannica]|nr:hypothetical protein BC828DRAFT_407916 [Blastocladiella britannica]